MQSAAPVLRGPEFLDVKHSSLWLEEGHQLSDSTHQASQTLISSQRASKHPGHPPLVIDSRPIPRIVPAEPPRQFPPLVYHIMPHSIQGSFSADQVFARDHPSGRDAGHVRYTASGPVSVSSTHPLPMPPLSMKFHAVRTAPSPDNPPSTTTPHTTTLPRLGSSQPPFRHICC